MMLCRRCYQFTLSVQMLPPMQLARVVMKSFGVSEADPYEFTPEHDRCENCPVEFRRLGHDPCLERLEFDHDVQEIGPYTRNSLRLFSFLMGHDAASMDGNFLQFFDVRVSNWLRDVDSGG